MSETDVTRRLRALERRVEDIHNSSTTVSPNPPKSTQRELQDVEVFVRKLQKKADGAGVAAGASLSTYSSACTSACFSSASTLCASGSLTAAAKDPELAQVFATLHRRGVEVMGEEEFMDEIIKQAGDNKPVNIFDIAEGR